MRVLFTTTPGWGHVHPMVPLAQAFVVRGDEVQWAAAPEVCARLDKVGFATTEAGLGEAESMTMFAEQFPEVTTIPPTERPLFMFPRIFGTIRAEPMLADLLPVVRDWRPTVVVAEAGELAGPIAAATVDAPSITHGFGTLLPRERVSAVAGAVAPLWEGQDLEPRPYGGSYDHLYLDIYPPSLRAGDRSHVPHVQPLRPVAFAAAGDEALPDWATCPPVAGQTEPPLVYVTFGTVFNTDLSQVAAAVDGLAGLPVRVVVTLGPRADPAVMGPQPPNVHVARYIPQTELLPHCAAVVSHAGSGTFLASLAQGLPHLCIPQAADQFDNAATCVRSGAGLALAPGTATAAAVREGVERLLSDPSFRSAAERVAGEIADMPGPDVAARIIGERFRDGPR
ncbi:MAG: glycosyltransferase [Acidimicrobiales bacterium]